LIDAKRTRRAVVKHSGNGSPGPARVKECTMSVPQLPKTESFSNTDVSELIRQFVSDGDDYMQWANMAWIRGMPSHPNDPPAPNGWFGQLGKGIDDPNSMEAHTLNRAHDAMQRMNEYRRKLLDNGPILTKALKSHGRDVKQLLCFLHGIDRAADIAGPLWPTLKAFLQEWELDLASGNGRGGKRTPVRKRNATLQVVVKDIIDNGELRRIGHKWKVLAENHKNELPRGTKPDTLRMAVKRELTRREQD